MRAGCVAATLVDMPHTPAARAPTLLRAVLLMAASSSALGQQQLHVQCPPGTGAALRGSVVTCEPLQKPAAVVRPPPPAPVPEPTPPSPRVETVIIQKPPVVEQAAPGHVAGMELKGLYAVPDLCGLFVEDKVREDAAEAVHLRVTECLESVDVVPPTQPARWFPIKVEAVTESVHVFSVPEEPWALALRQCLATRNPRLPRKVRGKTFTAHYLLAASAQQLPAQHPCAAQNPR